MLDILKHNVNHSVLSRDTELDLIKKAQAGDDLAMETLILHNIRIIYKIGMKYGVMKMFRHREDDVFQEGVIGLITTIRKFDVTSGLKLSTYSTHWIRQTMGRANERGDFTPFAQHSVGNGKMIFNILKVNESTDGLESFDVIWKRLYDMYGDKNLGYMTKRQAKITYDALATGDIVSSDNITSQFDEEDNSNILDNAEHSIFNDVSDNTYIDDSMSELLMKMIGELNEPYRDTLYHRFGINTEPKTLQAIGDMSGVSRERIRQRENKAIEMLRIRFERDGLEFNDFIS